MPIDPYAPCPAGTGKKVKFCCWDLASELEIIQRMVDGDQRLACLEHIDKLLERHPGRACLLTSKAMVALGLDRKEEAQRAVDEVLTAMPGNPVALSESAILALTNRDLVGAVDRLQTAIALSQEPMSPMIVNAMAMTADTLAYLGQILSARGHVNLLLTLMPRDEHALELMARMFASPGVPLVFKDDPMLRSAKAGAAWKPAFDEALQLALRGHWRGAIDKFVELGGKVTDSAEIWLNVAMLRAFLLDDDGAVEALRRVATLDVAEVEKVEAEALAQAIKLPPDQNSVDVVRITYPVTNAEELVGKLADPRLVSLAIDPKSWREADAPPPRLAYNLLDRREVRGATGISRADVPQVLARLLFFGRQTDREARLEVEAARPQLAQAQSLLAEICGSQLGPAGDEVVLASISSSQWALSWNWRLPEDLSADEVHRLLVEQRRYVVLEQWTKTPLAILEGLTPEAAAKEERLRIRLLGAVLTLELSFEEPTAVSVFAELRQKLGLPVEGSFALGEQTLDRVPLVRLHRLEPKSLSDDDLLMAFTRATFRHARLAIRMLAMEVLSREHLKEQISFAELYCLLSQLEDDTAQSLRYVEQARQLATKQSLAAVELRELALRLDRGEAEAFARVLQRLQTNHMREPGVAQAVAQLLMEAGLIGSDGSMAMPVAAGAPLADTLPPAEAGQLWTPETQSAGGKSSLWLPE